MDGGPEYKISVQELHEYASEWHEQGVEGSVLAAALEAAGRSEVAAIVKLSSMMQAINGNMFTVTAVICDRLEALTCAIYALEANIRESVDSGVARAKRLGDASADVES